MSHKPVRKVVYPVAGLGTRFLPATKAIPKEMLPIVDRPVIHYAVDEAREAAIEEFLFVTGRGKSAIEDHFDRAYELEAVLQERDKQKILKELYDGLPPPGQTAYTRQQEPLGLGHAIWCARHLVGDEPFAVSLPDMLVDASPSCLKQMVDAYEKVGGNIIAVAEVPPEETHRYGIIDPGETRDGVTEIRGLVEKPAPKDAPSNLFVVGRYILQPEIFALLERQRPGAGNEIQLTDAMHALLERQPFFAIKTDAHIYDCGDRLGFLHATLAMAMKREDLAPGIGEILRDVLAR
ncbi:MAG: UTP--glucose-1-phosphate uridylyltransferase GalU [Alphaproteobacteria bacterium]